MAIAGIGLAARTVLTLSRSELSLTRTILILPGTILTRRELARRELPLRELALRGVRRTGTELPPTRRELPRALLCVTRLSRP
ncbi:MAG TPA: hypothetical protein VK817_04235 [Trebonia sp.]|nr:hypothetical protein [Trebonia sp.]